MNNSVKILMINLQCHRNRKKVLEVYHEYIRFPALARAFDRMGVSDKSVALISSAPLGDLGVVTHDDMSDVIDRNKVRGERKENLVNAKSKISVSLPPVT